MTVNDVLPRLRGVKKTRNGWIALCPAHNDHNPSLSVRETPDRKVLLHCFAGCSYEEIIEAIGAEKTRRGTALDHKQKPAGWEKAARLLAERCDDERIRGAITASFRWGYEDLPNRSPAEVRHNLAYQNLCLVHRACHAVLGDAFAGDEEIETACRLLCATERLFYLLEEGDEDEVRAAIEEWS